MHAHTHARAHARTRAHMHTHTHTDELGFKHSWKQMEKRWVFNSSLKLNSLNMADRKLETIPDHRASIRRVFCPWNFLCLIKMHKSVDEQRDCERVYIWRRSARYLCNAWNTYNHIQLKCCKTKYGYIFGYAFSINWIHFLVTLMNPFIWCFVYIRNLICT